MALVWDAGDFGRPPVTLTHPGRKHFTGVAVHPSGRWLAATSNDATVRLYDTDTWALAQTLGFDIGKLKCVAFSPDGLLGAAGGEGGKVVAWDIDP